MKKLLISMIAIVLVATSASAVNAATANERLESYLKNGVTVGGQKYSLTSAQEVQLDRFLSANTLTTAQVDTAIAKANETINLVKGYDLSDPSKVPTAVKNQAINLAKEAGNAVGVNVKVDLASNKVVVTDVAGNVLASSSFTNGKLPFTGSNNVVYAIICTVLALSVAMVYSLKKGLASSEN